MKDYAEEFRSLIEGLEEKEIIFGKNERYVLDRIGATKSEVRDDLFSWKDLEFVEKQRRGEETRYVLFFVYSKKRGRVYAVTFRKSLRIITAYPIGRKTLAKYGKRKFIK